MFRFASGDFRFLGVITHPVIGAAHGIKLENIGGCDIVDKFRYDLLFRLGDG